MSRKILIAEDDLEDRVCLERLLEPYDFAVTSVENGEEAFAEIMDRKGNDSFDLLITDINMPLVNGIELVGLLRFSKCLLPIILASSSSTSRAINELGHYEFLDFIRKPVDLGTILEKINLLT